ncbi:hypothetical protein AAFF_G00244910 [Aldrovandia affinis]|uniref:Uncharacterized protein n=1 Tax=Aldrovandia affinis TaxID=143900 RepID=A0AAD7W3P1_9TELE|nr:hypothetical protein AAFF_G00244910 [Aldrovandia affinis]
MRPAEKLVLSAVVPPTDYARRVPLATNPNHNPNPVPSSCKDATRGTGEGTEHDNSREETEGHRVLLCSELFNPPLVTPTTVGVTAASAPLSDRGLNCQNEQPHSLLSSAGDNALPGACKNRLTLSFHPSPTPTHSGLSLLLLSGEFLRTFVTDRNKTSMVWRSCVLTEE